jgi:acyl-CoA thioester hydrolase
MGAYLFYHPIEVRYGDLDPQGHVNNARYLTFLEQARIAYVKKMGLWSGGSFLDLGVILADVHITFLRPIIFGEDLQVGVRFTHLGNKSMHVDQLINNPTTGQEFAKATIVLVKYDYHNQQTVPIPEHWRRMISEYESI